MTQSVSWLNVFQTPYDRLGPRAWRCRRRGAVRPRIRAANCNRCARAPAPSPPLTPIRLQKRRGRGWASVTRSHLLLVPLASGLAVRIAVQRSRACACCWPCAVDGLARLRRSRLLLFSSPRIQLASAQAQPSLMTCASATTCSSSQAHPSGTVASVTTVTNERPADCKGLWLSLATRCHPPQRTAARFPRQNQLQALARAS